MNHTDHQDIRIGTLAGKGTLTPEYIRQLIPLGFESFQINFHKGFPEGFDFKRMAREVKRVLDEAGDHAPVISSIGIFGNPVEEKKIVSDLRTAMQHAHLLGDSCRVIAAFTGCQTGQPVPDSIPAFRKVWAPLARRAADLGLRIAFENCAMGGTWQRASWNLALNPSAWNLLFDAVPDANLGLCWEPAHQLVQLIDPIPQLAQWVPRIFNVHGKDATIAWDVIRAKGLLGGVPFAWHRTPGFGDTDWTRVISILRQHQWSGSIDIEGWHDPVYRGDLELTGQVHGLEYLKRCRGGTFVPNPVL